MATPAGSTLRVVFEADHWGSTISFQPSIPVTLGGTLELTFATDVSVAEQVGRTFDLFDWTGVNPVGTFMVSSPYPWDLSKLYTTGEVTLLSLRTPGDANGDGFVNRADAAILASSFARTGDVLWSHGDFDGNGRVDLKDWATLQSNFGHGPSSPAAAVPEPSAGAMLLLGLVAATLFRNNRLRRRIK
jgi:hypothetical protein